MENFTLISHHLCPYVQRAAIVLAEKAVAYERKDIDLANKPDWFLKLSPLGKTPVLLVDDQPVFESAVICEYLDETLAPRMHPADPLQRARHRSWVEFGSSILNAIGIFYNAKDEVTLKHAAGEIQQKFGQLEAILDVGPYFGGEAFCIVDAVFGPVFRYLDTFDEICDFGFLKDQPRIRAWRKALSGRQSVRDAVSQDYPQRLLAFLRNRNSALSQRISAPELAKFPK